MRKAVGISLMLALAGILDGSAPLQLKAQSPLERGADGRTQTIVPGIDVASVQGLPFTGKDTIIRTRPIEGGSSVITSVVARVFRDSQGRVYRERHHFAPLNTDPQKTLYAFFLLDPTTKTRTECMTGSRRCTITRYEPRLDFPLPPVGPFDDGKQFLARESLGQQHVDGLDLVGTREITTISPGTVGNDRALTLTREFWYSPELKTNISVTRSDPREGTQEIHLSVLSRGEPDPSTFAIPSGYVVADLRVNSTPIK